MKEPLPPEGTRAMRLVFELLDSIQEPGRLTAIEGADGLLIVTEWKVFRSPDFHGLKQKMARTVIFDGRNLYEPAQMNDLGIDYFGIGRSSKVSAVDTSALTQDMNQYFGRPQELGTYSGLTN